MITRTNRDEERTSGPMTPLSSKGWPKWGIYTAAFLGLIYLLNPTAGIIEILPDNLPWIGNIDEGAAAVALWYGFLEIRNRKKNK